MTRHVVATSEELPPGARKIVMLGGRSIGVFNVGGQLFALRNRCPHNGAALCDGIVSGGLRSRGPGEFEWDASSPLLRCPWHGWEFDMRSGQSLCDPAATRVRSYPVRRAPGPFVAEAYPVERVDDVIVIDV